ncbi:DUF397 domain-containing protein [Streptomyces sp. NPDC057748]|uniref:DUF397 domain-containing protein n=1 Tax=unclassified Streptomyces TaxID=2593676 RepID=UPI00368D2446
MLPAGTRKYTARRPFASVTTGPGPPPVIASINPASRRPSSPYSSSSGGECIEVATCSHAVHIRDSKVPDGPTFAVAPGVWATFLTWADRRFAGPGEASRPGPTIVWELWTPWHTLRSWAAPLSSRVPRPSLTVGVNNFAHAQNLGRDLARGSLQFRSSDRRCGESGRCRFHQGHSRRFGRRHRRGRCAQSGLHQ